MKLLQTHHKLFSLMFLFSLLFMVMGCSVEWVGEAVNIINVIVPAIAGILGLLTAFGAKIPAGDITIVTNAATEATGDLQNVVLPLINEYNSTPAADQPALLAKIQAALATVIANWNKVLPSLHITDPATQAKVEAVVAAVAAEIQEIASIIPVIQGTMKMSEVADLPLPAKKFLKHFNQVLTAKTGDSSVDSVTPKFQLKG